MTKSIFRLGIIGIGRIARTYFPVLERMKSVQVAFLCDIVPEQMARAASDFPKLLGGAGQFASSDEAIDRLGRVDAVLIATPLSTHFMLAERVLKRGVRTLTEKPGVAKMEELKALYALAESFQTRFQVLYHFAYAPEVERFCALKEDLERVLGEVRGFGCDFQDPAVSGNLLTISPRKLGGSFLSSGVNALSVLERVCGLEGLRVLAHDAHQVPGLVDQNQEKVVPEVDSASLTEFGAPERHLTGVIRTDWEQGWNFKSTFLACESGTVLLDHTAQSIIVTDFAKGQSVTIPCANEISRQERQYQILFERSFFQPEPMEVTRARDERIHALLLGQN